MKKNTKIQAMKEGGKILSSIRNELMDMLEPGISFEILEKTAQKRITQHKGAQPSFSTVQGYSWATCITKNEGVCHGIPQHKKVEENDIITIDIGVLYKGFHTDSADSRYVGKPSQKIKKFLKTGTNALQTSIDQARIGNSVYDISKAMQKIVESKGYSMVYQLTGHGVGKKLHEEPSIPCIAEKRSKKQKLYDGQTLAIEVMYSMGDAYLECASDGWTYQTVDKSITGMFEHTVLVTQDKPEILTKNLY